MKMTMISLVVLGVAGAGLIAYADGEQPVAPKAQEQQPVQESADAEMLYSLVKRARADLREIRLAAGLSARAAAPEAGQPTRLERREGVGEHGGREGRGEGRGEHEAGLSAQAADGVSQVVAALPGEPEAARRPGPIVGNRPGPPGLRAQLFWAPAFIHCLMTSMSACERNGPPTGICTPTMPARPSSLCIR